MSDPPTRGGVMFYTQFGHTLYSDIAFTITSVIDSSQAYGVVEEYERD